MFLFSLELTEELGCLQVRSLWSDIDGMLSTNKEEQHIVESVLKGDVDQYKLDGTDRVLQIPRSLLERIEQLPHQVGMMIWVRSTFTCHYTAGLVLNVLFGCRMLFLSNESA